MEVNTEFTLDKLKENQSNRVKKTLNQLNLILKEYVESGGQDFSIATIGNKISPLNGGPGYEAIRATRNKHYRDLIEVWAGKAGTSTKKPKSIISSKKNHGEYDLLDRIGDPALRGIFGSIITERNRYRNEVNLLKSNSNIIIDRRPTAEKQFSGDVGDVRGVTNIITEKEYEALKYAVSDECMINNGWNKLQNGRVVESEYKTDIFPRGYIDAIKKIVNAYENDKNSSN